MKAIPSYPTRHPNWIDTDEESKPEKPSWKSRFIRTGLSFKRAFLIVLLFHVGLISGIYALSQLKAKPAKAIAANATNDPINNGPKSDALARNKWPQAESKPVVKALPPAPKKIASHPDTKKPAVSTPIVAKAPPAQPPVSQPLPNQTTAITNATPKNPAPLKQDDSALKEKFLTAKNTIPPAHEDGPVREALRVSPTIKPLATPNSEIPTLPPAIASTKPAPKPEAPRTTPAATPAPTEYTLSAGDNLYAVSRRFQVTYNDLMDANGITDPRQLRIGQKLKLPARKTDSTCSL